MEYYEEGVQAIRTQTIQYDSQKRITSVSEGGIYILSFSYTTSSDTTIMKIKYTEMNGDELGEELIKMKYDNTGKLLFLVLCGDDMAPDEKEIYTYNSSGDLIKEAYELLDPQGLSAGDSTTFQWDLVNHRVFARQFMDGEIVSIEEYEIDDNKRIVKCYDYDCEESCVKTGSYTQFIYSNSSVKKNRQFPGVAAQKYRANGFFSIDGRKIKKAGNSASGMIIDRQSSRIFQNLKKR